MTTGVAIGPLFAVVVTVGAPALPPQAPDPPAPIPLVLFNRVCSPQSAGIAPREVAAGRADVTAARERECADLQTLENEILALKKRIEELAAAQRLAPSAQVTAGKEGFALRSGDGRFELKLRGYLHSDGRFVGTGPGQRGVDSFLLRRVRPLVEVTSFGRFDLRIMPDFGEGKAVLQDAYAELRFGSTLRVRTGKFKAPFGLERLASATELQFAERGAPTLLAPNRDLGVMVTLIRGTVTYQAALMNGVPDGGSSDFDDNGGKDVVARVLAEPFRKSGPAALRGLGVAVALSAGTETGTRAIPGLPTFRTAGSQTFFRYRSDGTDAGTVTAGGRRDRYSLQAQYYYGRVGATSEWTATAERVRRDALSETLAAHAWLAATSLVLTGERATSRGVAPARDFDPANHRWGAFELVVRLTGLVLDPDAFPRFADPSASARRTLESAGGLNWYLNRTVKLSASVHRTAFTGGAARDANRAPERAILSRLQFAF